MLVQEVRRGRPGLLISLSPAVHPWAWEHYLLDWPKWSSWTASDRAPTAIGTAEPGQLGAPRWDEFVPQAYRLSYEDFGKDSSWEQLRPRSVVQPRGARSVGAPAQSVLQRWAGSAVASVSTRLAPAGSSPQAPRECGAGASGIMDIAAELPTTVRANWLRWPTACRPARTALP